MFIKLTKFDNRPVWINASFVVTVEPRKDGVGTLVVPIGDGFDYDVRESVEEVLAKLEGAPAAAVVPVPASDGLTAMPEDVSPEKAPPREPAAESAKEPKKPRKRTVRAKAKKDQEGSAAEPSAPAAEAAASEPSVPADVAPAANVPPPPLELGEDQVARLAKLAPKSVSKLKNTLASQFHVADLNATVAALAAQGTFSIDGARVIWP